MATAHEVGAKAVSTTKRCDPLRTKYFCQVTQKQHAEVVMQMLATESRVARRLPLRYVLVIDVSASMKERVGSSNESLLDRVKIFAELLVQKVSHNDSIALVTFSHDVQVNIPMTVMSQQAKKQAIDVIQTMITRGSTNLEIGLMTGLEVLKKSPSNKNRDYIIVFTDGIATEGETEAEKLVQKYKAAHSGLKKASYVPISAFMIGHCFPKLLEKIADQLGSEAFYWLDENEVFEADMLLPVFLREETQVTDVNVEISCLQRAKFKVDDVSKKYLLQSSDEKLTYFFHSLPLDAKKHIPFTLVFPPQNYEEISGKRIADIVVTYLDGELKKIQINDFVELMTTTLSETRKSDMDGKVDLMNEVAAYSVVNNKVTATWAAAQESLVTIADDKCRRMSLIAIQSISEDDKKDHDRQHAIREAMLEINSLKEKYTTLLGGGKAHVKQLTKCINDWIAKLDFCKTHTNFALLLATKSSLAAEMPTAKGVFDSKIKRPFLPPRVEKRLLEFEKTVKKAKNERKKTSFQTSSAFKAQNVLVSESLRDKKVGPRQETVTELIVRCGGRPVPNVNTVFNNTFLVCSGKDYKKRSLLVRDSKAAHIPIVKEQFIYDCVSEKRMLKLNDYLLDAGRVIMSET